MEEARLDCIATIRLQYQRAEGEPMIDCGVVEMKEKEGN